MYTVTHFIQTCWSVVILRSVGDWDQYKLYLKIQLVPRSEHTPSQL
jgi:hypothetical protein